MAINRMEKTVNGVEDVRKGGFWAGKEACWETCHCPEMVKAECPAVRYQFLPCWEIEGTYCKLDDRGANGRDTTICQNCPVYLKYGQGKEIEIRLFGRGLDTGLRELEKVAV
jgi:hypothetical protein